MTRLPCLLVAAACLWACRVSSPTELGPHVPTPLTETQAHLVIEQRLLADHTVLAQAQGATLDGVGAAHVDFVFGAPARGVLWLTAQDRAAGGSWPTPDPGSALRVVTGVLDDGDPIQVLLLDVGEYLYEGNPRWVQRGAPGIDSVEDQVARDVGEFLEYVAAEDAPLSGP